jgi:hypothetical protein
LYEGNRGFVMTEFFKTSKIWVIDFRYDGRARRWFKAFGPGDDVFELMALQLRDTYGPRAQLVAVAPATDEEESQYLRGEEAKNSYCPTGVAGNPPDASS